LKNKGFESIESIQDLKLGSLQWKINDVETYMFERTSPNNDHNTLNIGVLHTQATYFKDAYDTSFRNASIKRKSGNYNE
jgi:hypothetical protein